MNLRKDALEILKATSRTFYIPISRLPSGLQEAVASAYLFRISHKQSLRS